MAEDMETPVNSCAKLKHDTMDSFEVIGRLIEETVPCPEMPIDAGSDKVMPMVLPSVADA